MSTAGKCVIVGDNVTPSHPAPSAQLGPFLRLRALGTRLIAPAYPCTACARACASSVYAGMRVPQGLKTLPVGQANNRTGIFEGFGDPAGVRALRALRAGPRHHPIQIEHSLHIVLRRRGICIAAVIGSRQHQPHPALPTQPGRCHRGEPSRLTANGRGGRGRRGR